MDHKEDESTSAGHQLGQVVGNWYEEYVALPILERVAERLNLYCDSRFKSRTCRGEKIIWSDSDSNDVDYDFVLELGGTDDLRGLPVAFFETFWRRGSRHSKDKARDDSGKLVGMRDAYPTARHLGIIAAGDFTQPAQFLIRSRGIDLFYIAKEKILSSWSEHGIQIDYPDKTPETKKKEIAKKATKEIERHPEVLAAIAASVFKKIGLAEREAFESRVAGKIGAAPQTYVIYVFDSIAHTFSDRLGVDKFLQNREPMQSNLQGQRSYGYEVIFGDGDIFYRDGLGWSEINELHLALDALIKHMTTLAKSR